MLLRHMNWNKERLIERYMDNSSAISVAAGIALPAPTPPPEPAPVSRAQAIANNTSARLGLRRLSRKTSHQESTSVSKVIASEAAKPTPSTPFVCPICFDDTQTRTFALTCGHAFCTSCWHAYLASKIRDDGEHGVRCMAQGCAMIASDPAVQTLLFGTEDRDVGKAAWERYQELLVRHFVGSNPNLKYCPYPACTYTVSCPSASSKSALTTVVPTVRCGASDSSPHLFCFGCAIDGDHRPIVCGVAKMWLKKCRDDSETANWIKSNTKECSQCQSTIEKNGGCK